MRNLKEFEKFLEKDHHPDAWADCASDDAHLIIRRFSDEEWEALKKLWPQKSKDWQVRLAYVLGGENPKTSLQILEEMVYASNPLVSVTALETLEVSDDVYRPSPK
mgnify:CR=1 FL=1